MKKWILLLAAPLFLCQFSSRAGSDPVIWLAPLSTITFNGVPGARDYMSLFEPDAPWQNVVKSVSIFKLYPTFVGRASDNDLRLLFADLKRRNIAVALEARVLSRTSGCTMKNGDGGSSTINLLRRIQRLGGKLDYIAMDEPLKHGLQGSPNCRANLEQIATDIAENIQLYRTVFPNLRVGDIEPVGSWAGAPNLVADTIRWIDVYKVHMKENISFFHSDVGWNTDWIAPNLSLQQELKRRGIPFGMIYNGNDPPKSDQQWASDTEQHYVAFEGLAEPDQVIFQTWRSFPTKVLPETDPLSLTGAVRIYLEYRKQQSNSRKAVP